MVEGHGQWSITKAHSHWSNGGAIGLHWKCKLWTGIAQAPFNSQLCNLRPIMRLLMTNNFAILTFDLWPLDLPPFWIIWKTVKIKVLLGFSCNVHGNFYTWTLDLYRQNVRMEMILIHKITFLWANENCSFMQIIILPLTHACRVILDRGACQISLKPLLLQIVKWWRYSYQLKIKLQTCIAQALFDRQPCNFRPHMRLLMPYNFVSWTYDLWPLDLRPFWIIWKTVKIKVLLGFSCKVHETFYTWSVDLYGKTLWRKLF